MNQVFLADTIDWVGVVVALVGAVIVAPQGFMELLRQIRTGIRRLLRLKPRVQHMSVGFSSETNVNVDAAHAFPPINEAAPAEELLQQLARGVTALYEEVLQIEKDSVDRDTAIRRQFIEIVGKLSQSNAELTRRLDQADHESASFNARGLPLIAMGTLMTGPNGILAECFVFGVLIVVAAVALMIYGIWPWRGQIAARVKAAARTVRQRSA